MKRKLILLFILLLSACSAVPTEQPPVDFKPPADYVPTIFDIEVESPISPERTLDQRPNIIFILTDDQPVQTVDYMPTVKNVLAAGGVNFTNGFATTPLCCPSRASILSGQYVHNHKVYTNRMPMGGAPKFDDDSTLATWMQDAGYRTAYIGKYLNDYEDLQPKGVVPPGWDEWDAFVGNGADMAEDVGNLQYYFNFMLSEDGTIVEYPRKKSNFGTDVVTTKAVDFINRARNEPFFLFVGYYNPHSPYVSAPRHKETFRSDWDWTPYRPPNLNEKDISDKPAYIGDLYPLSEKELDTAHKQILRSLLSVDDGVASILNALDKTGLSDNTIIVYLSDNGMTLGDHRFGVTKNCPYEACIKIPFIVYAPSLFPARSDDNFVANIDLASTFVDMAGGTLPDPEKVDGVSLLPLLKDANVDWRDDILLEHWPTEEGVGSMIPEYYAVRNHEWKYVEYVTGEKELYDLVHDPYELKNVAGRSKYRQIEAELAQRLAELKQE
jgi:arylsulfatase A-like enzyme